MIIDDATREECRAAIGRERIDRDSMAPEAAGKLAVVLDVANPGDALPPTWHWIYFARPVAEVDQGHDLHERTGAFLPAAPFPRRMWAAGDLRVHQPLRIGLPATQRTLIESVAFKDGRSGAMCFVTLRMEIEQQGRTCLEEARTIVYRDRGAPASPLRAPGDPVPEGYRTYPDGALFFYSALTHNGHRIHWDRIYCRQVEGYPDLVVHGPLMATDLCDAMRDGEAACRFTYRAQAPVFTTSPVRIEPGPSGATRNGRILRSDGVVSMSATLSQP